MAKRRTGGVNLIAVLQGAVQHCGLSLNELARRSGVSQPQLSRFMRNERMLSLPAAAKLFESLGLEVTTAQPEAVKPPKKK